MLFDVKTRRERGLRKERKKEIDRERERERERKSATPLKKLKKQA